MQVALGTISIFPKIPEIGTTNYFASVLCNDLASSILGPLQIGLYL